MTIDEIRKLLENVTSGPWDATHIFDGEETITQRSNDETPHFLGTLRYQTDAEFIAAARTLLPKLLAVAEAAKVEALQWNESYSTRQECVQIDTAWKALQDALAALDLA